MSKQSRSKRSRRYKRKLRKYAKKARHAYDSGVNIWNRLNTPQNKKSLAKMGKRASRMQENILDML